MCSCHWSKSLPSIVHFNKVFWYLCIFIVYIRFLFTEVKTNTYVDKQSHATKSLTWLYICTLFFNSLYFFYQIAGICQPWINRQIKQLTKRKQRAYNRYKKTQSAKDYANYKHLKNVVHSTCVKRYNEYVNDIIMDENHKPKRLWSFIKNKRVAPLKKDGIAYIDARMKAQTSWTSSSLQCSHQRIPYSPYQTWAPAHILLFQISL